MVVQLRMTQPNLEDSSQECINHKDVLLFCQSIIAAHRLGAFGDKVVLGDFFCDIAQNLNKKKAKYWFTKNSKLFVLAMKIYVGCRMCNIFALNNGGPCYATIRCQNEKGVPSL